MKKVYVVTGGSGGIGLETAKQFKDDIVIITDINEEGLKRGKNELVAMGISVETAICDVSKREQIAVTLQKAAKFGEIAGVVHTAGVSASIPNIELILNIDLLGTAILLEELLPYVNENTSVVCVASMMGYTITDSTYNKILVSCLDEGALEKIVGFAANDPSIAYNIAKRGVQLLCERWALDYGKKGARINSVSPGIIETAMAVEASKKFPEQMQYMQSMTPLGRNGQPSDVVHTIVYLCSPLASFITGADILIDGGLIKNMLAKQNA